MASELARIISMVATVLCLLGVAPVICARAQLDNGSGISSSMIHSKAIDEREMEGLRHARQLTQADPNKDLVNALVDGDVKAFNRAVEAGADIELLIGPVSDTPLIIAALRGDLPIVEALLEAGADVDATDAEGTTALFGAAQEGHLDIVNALLSAGAKVDAQRTVDGGTAIIAAAQLGHMDVVEALLLVGADVDTRTFADVTALAIAAQVGNVDVVKLLLEAEADPNMADDQGVTPLHYASLTLGTASEEIIKALVDAGAKIDTQSSAGETPLIWAAHFGNVGTSKVLLERGADASIATPSGETAIDRICGCSAKSEEAGARKCPKGGCSKGNKKSTMKEIEKLLA